MQSGKVPSSQGVEPFVQRISLAPALVLAYFPPVAKFRHFAPHHQRGDTRADQLGATLAWGQLKSGTCGLLKWKNRAHLELSTVFRIRSRPDFAGRAANN